MALNINGTTGISGVDGSVSAPALTGTDSNTGITFPSADTIKFSTGGIERLAITNSGVTGSGIGGITMADQWRINTTFQSQAENIAFNWERVDTDFAQIGTGMSYSSGTFSFPQTGIYLVHFIATISRANVATRYMGVSMSFTTDNSNYNNRAEGFGNVINSVSSYTQAQVLQIFDVTDTSTHKVRFNTNSVATVTYYGSTTRNGTVATFIRLGDT